jgi:hypothetical protein
MKDVMNGPVSWQIKLCSVEANHVFDLKRAQVFREQFTFVFSLNTQVFGREKHAPSGQFQTCEVSGHGLNSVIVCPEQLADSALFVQLHQELFQKMKPD